MSSGFLAGWRGLLLAGLGIAATVWLALSGKLGLYIHPRYFVFTVVMAIVGGALTIGAAAWLGARDRAMRRDDGAGGSDDAAEHEGHAHGGGATWLGTAATGVIIVVSAVVLLLVPPSSLSTSAAASRDLSGASLAADSADAPALVGGDASAFTVKDWASLLRQGVTAQDLAGKTADVTGFVTADPESSEIFYLARYVVTCCAVDAQPVGVPVYAPDWRDVVEEGAWAEVQGPFVDNPSAASAEAIVLSATTVTPVDEPSTPYLY